MNRDFEKVFEGILGTPCWGVKRGVGSFFTLEFGKPHLEIREPIAAREGASVRVRKHLARRQVYVHGEWHLRIYCCDWEVHAKGKPIGGSSTKLGIRRAVDILNGQKLIHFSIVPRTVRSIFIFDLGAKLTTSPHDKNSEQWLIFGPSKKVLVLRADGRYRYVRSDEPVNERAWKTL